MAAILVTNRVWKIPCDSNVYYIEEINTLIDTGNLSNKELLKESLKEINANVLNVIFTHLHYDHIGNFDLFLNSNFYASSESIKAREKDSIGQILNQKINTDFNVELNDIANFKLPSHYTIINSPGHTSGSICIYDSKKKILYSGDTIFDDGYGRTDLPSGSSKQLAESLKNLSELDVKILCSGHDY